MITSHCSSEARKSPLVVCALSLAALGLTGCVETTGWQAAKADSSPTGHAASFTAEEQSVPLSEPTQRESNLHQSIAIHAGESPPSVGEAGVTEAEATPPARKFVRKWTINDLRPDLHRIGAGRSFSSGKEMFKVATCSECHRIYQVGGTLGPDLTGVAGRNSRVAVLRETIEPSKQIPDTYQSTVIVTTSGRVHQGLVVRQDDKSISLANDPRNPDQLLRISMDDIAERSKSTVSMMPEGLLNSLAKDEILDLLAYIESGGQEDHPVFEPTE